jgi:hypothetical protein
MVVHRDEEVRRDLDFIGGEAVGEEVGEEGMDFL